VNPGSSDDTLTVLYDGACPLCRREIAHVRGLAQRRPDSALCFVDISGDAGDAVAAADRKVLLARFHVQRADGSRLDGAAAFVAMWGRLPGWRWLARLARLPGVLVLLEWAYRGFLRVRPALQAAARRRQTAQETASEPAGGRSPRTECELRCDPAGVPAPQPPVEATPRSPPGTRRAGSDADLQQLRTERP
jgi:predicted DCC family thiol-disulfide oxidoreductase YuxK